MCCCRSVSELADVNSQSSVGVYNFLDVCVHIVYLFIRGVESELEFPGVRGFARSRKSECLI